ncbi:dTDP-glucose 4,6-dehydratase [Criibacterium bergeronii]|uniref:dTDP-glucose 4,6-dehydratase n=1 Tax=Criibacterium bergeronii TaxID=1871336 RepID=A0A371ILG3_9FIRM|nr:dTDP-glucose 4,6-dehydratase [Criibacterium bergeronii]MBS6064160.1 dTDP-glucose 4,6-dehydratase [Peptostreptococcaceae bacterium]RDY21328.1 dTDP-glucose 4,6-dehydratase [Criibacterium bergeronii]TRW27961.1 dTDP-glucose 4,6-dehydratase [Criibacterium bergeronii]
MKNILVTGGAGFIGSNFIKYVLEKNEYNVINLDLLTYAGNLENLKDISNPDKYTFIKGDICDKDLVQSIFEKYDIDTVVNFAAESHVDRSIENPEIFLQTNVYGTVNLLENAKKYWKIDKENKYSTEYKQGVKYLQVSTDEVYGALGKAGMFTEDTNIQPNSPYSASKASADLFVRAYHNTFGLPTNITRCSNNYGPYQFPEKLIPLMINNCIENKSLPVYGDGMQIRDWLHVKDHCTAIFTVLQKGKIGEVYNIGGNNEKANIEIVKLIINALGKSEDLITYVKDRPGHDRRYAIDNSKITNKLGWSPSYTFEQGIKETVQWFIDNQEWMKNIVSGDYMKYYDNMYKKAEIK